jgi:NADH:ubiquinone oxidoreductase subunit D
MTGFHYPQEGERWTFVHSDGRVTPYIVQAVSPEFEAFAGQVNLINPDTGRLARINTAWMRQVPTAGRSYWLPPEAP